MRRDILVVLAAMMLPLGAAAQKPYQKKYNNSDQSSVEGTLNDQGLRTGNWTWWYPDGRVSQQGSYVNGERVGVWTSYYTDGSRMAEECYVNGTSRSWHRNGDLKSEVEVKNGKRTGVYRSWHDNGQKEEEVTYVDGSREGAAVV